MRESQCSQMVPQGQGRGHGLRYDDCISSAVLAERNRCWIPGRSSPAGRGAWPPRRPVSRASSTSRKGLMCAACSSLTRISHTSFLPMWMPMASGRTVTHTPMSPLPSSRPSKKSGVGLRADEVMPAGDGSRLQFRRTALGGFGCQSDARSSGGSEKASPGGVRYRGLPVAGAIFAAIRAPRPSWRSRRFVWPPAHRGRSGSSAKTAAAPRFSGSPAAARVPPPPGGT